MAWYFRRRLKVIPRVLLNFSKNGISTSIGVREVNLTCNNNIGIPRIDIYNRTEVSGNDSSIIDYSNLEFSSKTDSNDVKITSSDILSIKEQGLIGVKETIEYARYQRTQIKSDVEKIKRIILWNKIKKAFYFVLYPLLKKTIMNISEDIKLQYSAIEQLEKAQEDSYVIVDIKFTPRIKECYDSFLESFKNITCSHAIWDIISSKHIDKVRERSWASSLIERKKVRFSINSLIDIKTSFDVPFLTNANNLNLYIYPNFVVLYSKKEGFDVIDLNDIDIKCNYMNFVESQSVPSDSQILYYTWDKVNKDGSRDKRFKNNYQIPVVEYGEIYIRSKNGINECYHISNYNKAVKFVKKFNTYKSEMKKCGH